ncbi:MAG: hypothetical protein JXX28_09795 [Deltaproteobacteria bacterium]|nr:hypothetical protein [Deltaproteobacteria bacterium]
MSKQDEIALPEHFRPLLSLGRVRVVEDLRRGVQRAVRVEEHQENIAVRVEDAARRAMRLVHPHIASIHEVIRVGGGVLVVEELLAGGQVDARGRLAPREAAQVLEDVLLALGMAHRVGQWHGHVVPGNVLRTADGVVKLTDFGLARAAGPAGEDPLAAPELRAGGRGGPSADLFGAAALMVQLVLGSVPPQLFLLGEGAPELAALPAPLREWVLAATRFEPGQRFSSAEQMLEALRRSAVGLPAASAVAAPSLERQLTDPGAPARRVAPVSRRAVEERALARLQAAQDAVPAPPGDGEPVPLGRWALEEPMGEAPEQEASLEDGPEQEASLDEDRAPHPPPQRGSRLLWGALALVFVGVVAGAWQAASRVGTPAAERAEASAHETPEGLDAAPPGEEAPAEAQAPASPEPGLQDPVPTDPIPPSLVPEDPAPPARVPEPAPADPSRSAAPTPKPPKTAAPVPAAACKQGTSTNKPTPASVFVGETGTLFVTSRPWSNLAINGRPLGRSHKQYEVPTGCHTLTLTTVDGRSHDIEVTVAGDELRVCWDFDLGQACSR